MQTNNRDLYQYFVDFGPIITSAVGLLFVWFQLKKMNDQTMNQVQQIETDLKKLSFDKSAMKYQKAIDVAYEFSKLIDPDMDYVLHLLKSNIQYTKLLNSDVRKEFRSFDFDEAKRLLSIESIAELKKITSFESLSKKSIFEAYYIYFISEQEKEMYYILKENDFDLTKSILMYPDEINKLNDLSDRARNKVIFTIYGTLNKLEWLSMHFSTSIADEQVVYQSLHQLFLHTVALLYFFIVEKNSEDITEKYYTNVIDLYVSWTEKVEKKRKEIHSILLQQQDQSNSVVAPLKAVFKESLKVD